MSATTTITRMKRPAGMCRLAAQPRFVAVAGDVCAIASGFVGRGSNGSGLTAGVTLRDRGGDLHQVGIEARRYTHVRITSFSAEVSLGASPG